MKKDVPIEIEIEVFEAGQPRPQRPGPKPFGVARLRLFPGSSLEARSWSQRVRVGLGQRRV